jgi:Dyp-type peroxidase family
VPPILAEPELDADEIQGHVLVGFGAAEQAIAAFTGTDLPALGSVIGRWAQQGRITSTRRLMRRKGRPAREVVAGSGPWVAVAVSRRLLAACGLPVQFDDPWFTSARGMAGVAGLRDAKPADGSPLGSDWLVGAPSAPVDVLVVVAAGTSGAARDVISILEAEVGDAAPPPFVEPLQPIVGNLEHFGFRDGISQPAVLGTVDGKPFQGQRPIDGDDVRRALHEQDLIWPGEFVYGYPGQSDDPAVPGPDPGPQDVATRAVARNGSLLVYRRLTQDVAAFRAFCAARSAEIGLGAGWEELATRFVGRHRSGVPITLPLTEKFSPERDNGFTFADDDMAEVCPPAAHIRKVNPRQGPRDVPLVPRILRRGAPFGPLFVEDEATGPPGGRGLAFLSYQTSAEHQFGRLTRDWMNDDVAPSGSGGHDILVGQVGPDSSRHFDLHLGGVPRRITAGHDERWVTMTGGSFLFAPSLSTLRSLGREDEGVRGE